MMDLAGKRITVMGLGRFGGGIGVTRWLCSQGAEVLVTDKDSAEDLADSVARIQSLIDSGQVTLRLGEHNVSDFTTCDLVVANAAVSKPWENRFLRSAEAAGIPVTTEISLTVEQLRARHVTRTVGITGSAGKSTTTAMIQHALHQVLGPTGTNVFMGGNIGGSLLADLDRISPSSIVVLELSSAMLYWLERTLTPKWSPRVAVVTNVSANHIDWHGDFDHYAASKKHLIEHQHPGDTAVLGASLWDWRGATAARTERIDPSSFSRPLLLPGDHNRTNAAGALAACRAIAPEADKQQLAAAIASFPGLAHRLQLVAETKLADRPGDPIRFYNDSKSTTPESALKAIEALEGIPGFARSRLHLIAGGYDKGSDLSPIARLGPQLAGLYTIGVTGPTIARAADGRAVECETVCRAVEIAMKNMRPGDALLLSPGCASWDQYVNFEERGDEFVRLVKEAVAR
jgi:UDP-N-acetylmuramoylalanine--D-glutamate ligase